MIRVVLSQEDHARDFVTQHKARELLLRSKRVLFVSTKSDNYQGLSLSLQQVGVELNFVKPAEAAEHVADGNYDIVAIETAILGAHLSGLFQLTRGQRPSPLFVGVGSAPPVLPPEMDAWWDNDPERHVLLEVLSFPSYQR